jgi:hypothetical protein
MNDQNTADAWEYRKLASQHLAIAKGVAMNDGAPIPSYYALELRRTIEAYCYSLLCTYRPEMSAADLETWQPHQVIRALRGIDPDADKSKKLQFENTDGTYYDVGTDHRLGYRWISENYNRLSSILHVPIVAKMKEPPRSPEEIRAICDAIAEDLEFILSQERWNFVIGVFCHIKCRCGFTMRRRPENLEPGGRIICAMCSNVYAIDAIEDGKVYTSICWHRFVCQHCGTHNGYQEREGVSDFLVRCRNPDCREPAQFFKAWAWRQAKLPGTMPEAEVPIAFDPDVILEDPA